MPSRQTTRSIYLSPQSQLLSPLYIPRRTSTHLAPLISKFETLNAATEIASKYFEVAECTPSPLKIPKRKTENKRGTLPGMRWWKSGDGGGDEDEPIAKPGVVSRPTETVVKRLARLFDRGEEVKRRGTEGDVGWKVGKASERARRTTDAADGEAFVVSTEKESMVERKTPLRNLPAEKRVDGRPLLKMDTSFTSPDKSFKNGGDVIQTTHSTAKLTIPQTQPDSKSGFVDKYGNGAKSSMKLEMGGGRAKTGYGDEKRLGNNPAESTAARKGSLKITPTRTKEYTAKELSRNLNTNGKVDRNIEEVGKNMRDIKHAKDVFEASNEHEWINLSRKATPPSPARPSGKKDTGQQTIVSQEVQTGEHPNLKCIHVHEKPQEQQRTRRESKIADRIRLFDLAAKPFSTPLEQISTQVNPENNNQICISGTHRTSSKRKSEPMVRKPPPTVDVHRDKASTPEPTTQIPRNHNSIIQNPRRLSKLMDRIMLWENVSVSSISATSPTKSSYSTTTQSTKPAQNALSTSNTAYDSPSHISEGQKKNWKGQYSITAFSQNRQNGLDLKDIHEVLNSLDVSPMRSPTESMARKPWHSTTSKDITHRNTFRDTVSSKMTQNGASGKWNSQFVKRGVNGMDGSDEARDELRENLTISESGCELLEPKPVRMLETVRLMQLCAKFGQTVRLKKKVITKESGEDEMF